MLVSKDGEIVQCGSGKSHWPFRGCIEATGCCGTPRCQSEYHIPTAALIQGCTWCEGYAKKWETTYHHRQSGLFNSPGDVEQSSHHCIQPTYRCAISDVMAGGCLYRPPGTGYVLPSWKPRNHSCTGASPINSWSNNNWVHWWPVLPVRSGSLLALRDIGKFLLDPTSLQPVSFVVIKILGHTKWHMKGNWYTYKMA